MQTSQTYSRAVTRNGKGNFVRVVVAAAVLMLLAALYIAVLRLSVDITRTDLGRSQETRDTVYLAIHGALILLSAILGFLTGRFVAGMGFAYATLFVMLTMAVMAAVQVGSFSLACNGHNDLVRHWTC